VSLDNIIGCLSPSCEWIIKTNHKRKIQPRRWTRATVTCLTPNRPSRCIQTSTPSVITSGQSSSIVGRTLAVHVCRRRICRCCQQQANVVAVYIALADCRCAVAKFVEVRNSGQSSPEGRITFGDTLTSVKYSVACAEGNLYAKKPAWSVQELFRFDTTSACNRQTDRQTHDDGTYIARYRSLWTPSCWLYTLSVG